MFKKNNLMKFNFLLCAVIFFAAISCNNNNNEIEPGKQEKTERPEKKIDLPKVSESEVSLDSVRAAILASLPLKCMNTEYPNKTGQVLSDSTDLGSPRQLHPAFYGCFDWHSSVHGHWSLVKLAKDFPELENRDSIIERLQMNISKSNISKEIEYFKREQEYSFERMYGWAWLLKLQSELDEWQFDKGIEMAENLRPLSELIVSRYIEFLPKLDHPIRVGTHGNSAFGMIFAYDYAKKSENSELKKVIEETSRRLYLKDKNAPIEWEPDGFDFFSPVLEEIDLMHRILPRDEFSYWIDDFMPQLKSSRFQMKPVSVSDRTDGHLVHLDGLNFSRAWVFYRLAKEMPNEYGHLKMLGDVHLAASLPLITDGSYEGEHWLSSFALYALSER